MKRIKKDEILKTLSDKDRAVFKYIERKFEENQKKPLLISISEIVKNVGITHTEVKVSLRTLNYHRLLNNHYNYNGSIEKIS